MKKLLALFLVLLFSFSACQGHKTETDSQTAYSDAPLVEKTDNEQVIKAFTGDLSDKEQSDELRMQVFKTYEYHCEPIEVNDKCSVVFTAGQDVKSCRVPLYSNVDVNDIKSELNAYYDSFIPTTVTDGVVAVYVGGLYSGEFEADSIRSFLVKTADESGENVQYYYFRVKYNPRAENENIKPVTIPDDFDYDQWKFKHNGKLYKATDRVGELDEMFERIGTVMGCVEEASTPTLNGFSNFGCVGSGYCYNDEGELQVFTPDGCLRYFEIC